MEALVVKASSFRLFERACVFNRAGNLKRVAGLNLRNKLNYTHTKIGAKVQPHQPSVLIVYPTQMLKYLRFV